jgi:hypothetical protein
MLNKIFFIFLFSLALTPAHNLSMEPPPDRGVQRQADTFSTQSDKKILMAAASGDEAGVLAALGGSESINIQDAIGCTPLMLAAANGHEVVVRLLLGCGADVNLANSRRITPLNVAATKGHISIVIALLSHQAQLEIGNNEDPTLPNGNGQILIEWGAQQENGNLVRQLLLYGASAPEAVIRSYLSSRLTAEAVLGTVVVVQNMLLDPEVTQQEREEALLYAATQRQKKVVEIVKILEKTSARVRAAVRSILRRRGLGLNEARRYQEVEQMLLEAESVSRQSVYLATRP